MGKHADKQAPSGTRDMNRLSIPLLKSCWPMAPALHRQSGDLGKSPYFGQFFTPPVRLRPLWAFRRWIATAADEHRPKVPPNGKQGTRNLSSAGPPLFAASAIGPKSRWPAECSDRVAGEIRDRPHHPPCRPLESAVARNLMLSRNRRQNEMQRGLPVGSPASRGDGRTRWGWCRTARQRALQGLWSG
jgi:hypothetical protein